MDHLEIINLHKEYEGVPLLNGVNFQVSAGEILCLLGSSGSGKSTILRIIADIETTDMGKVVWNGEDICNLPTHKRGFGLMFQDYALFPHLTVLENVAFGLRMKGETRIQVQTVVQAALTQVNMTNFGARRVTDLSGGEQQRIALARALAPRPKMLMLDEPLAALDQSLRDGLQEELQLILHRAGIPVIYVTHNQEEALIVSDRLALLHEGRIVQMGVTKTVFRNPATRWAAEFLGLHNFLPGKITSVTPLKVLTGCGIFQCQTALGKSNSQINDRVTLLFLPTGINFFPEPGAENVLSGRVIMSAFRADHYKVQIKVSSGELMEITTTSPVPHDTTLNLYFDPEDVICLQE